MEEELYGLTKDQMSRVSRLLQLFEKQDGQSPSQIRRPPLTGAKILIGALTNSVSATTGLLTKPKVGTLNVYSFTSTGTVDTGIDETVYNFAPAAATTDRWTIAERDAITGKLIITTQFCS